MVATTGSFTKTEQSDIQSIVTGMIGFKGRVHVAFGEELQFTSADPDIIAAEIDAQILQAYQLRDINFLALARLQQDGSVPSTLLTRPMEAREIEPALREAFEKRLHEVEPKLRKHFLFSYANPVINRYSA